MKLEVHIHLHHHDADGELIARLDRIERKITMNDAELKASLEATNTAVADVSSQLNKGFGEVSAQITALQEALANAGNTSPEVDALVTSLSDKVTAMKQVTQALDDLNPDTPPTP